MTKYEFIKIFAKKANLTQKDAKEVNDAYWDAVAECMKSDKTVTLTNGVKGELTHRNERNGRNPLTGESIVIPEKDIPRIKLGKTFKELFY